MALLDAEIMVVNLEPEANFLELCIRLVTAGVTSLLSGFVLELAVIHELGNRRLGVGRNLDQVQTGFFGQSQGVFNTNDTDLFPSGSNEANLGDTDSLVDASLADEWLLPQKLRQGNEKPPLRLMRTEAHVAVSTRVC